MAANYFQPPKRPSHNKKSIWLFAAAGLVMVILVVIVVILGNPNTENQLADEGNANEVSSDNEDAGSPDSVKVDLPESPPWNVQVESIPEEASELLDKVKLPKIPGDVKICPSQGTAVVTFLKRRPRKPNGDWPKFYLIQKIDLRTGEPVASFEIDTSLLDLLDFSVDGKHVLLANNIGDNQQLEMWSWSGDNATQTAKWPPMDGIYWARVVDASHVLIRNSRAGTDCWQVPEVKQLYSTNDSRDTLATSLLRGYLTIFNQKFHRLEFLDSRTNKLVGVLPLGNETYTINGMGYRADGKIFAALTGPSSANKNSRLIQWDVGTGQMISSTDIDIVGGPITWCSNRFMLIGMTLVEAKRGIPLWHYLGADPQLPSRNNSLWSSRNQWIYRVEYPGALSKEPAEELIRNAPELVASGAEVAIEMHFDLPAPPRVREELEQILVRKLSEAKYVVKENSQIKFQLSVKDIAREGHLIVRSRRNNSKRQIPNRVLAWQAAFRSPMGDSLQAMGDVRIPGALTGVSVVTGSDVQQSLFNGRWDLLPSDVSRINLPRMVLKVRDDDELKTTSISHDGEKPYTSIFKKN